MRGKRSNLGSRKRSSSYLIPFGLLWEADPNQGGRGFTRTESPTPACVP